MSTFFVGQRVRIVFSERWPELAGEEGRIVGEPESRFVEPNAGPWEVAPDCWGSSQDPLGVAWFAPRNEQLEPITPDGHRASDYSFSELMDECREVMA